MVFQLDFRRITRGVLGIINVMWYEMEQHEDNVAKDQDSDNQA